ncbi:MAG: aminoacyl-tRNA hydrolase [Parachlamydia sp.]|jgi:PTH1 family peptidyl-tRNA hydrolase|nr:aminoacyl-tRNA hydrolase [Parachlamydia sp.]
MPADPVYLFVGLGNPGAEYEMTRHNLGHLVVKAFGKKMGWPFKLDRRFNALVAKGMKGRASIHLLLPMTYMNLSGTAVRCYLDFYKWPAQIITVVTDDIALPFGKMRLRAAGSSGGHNGLKSIENHLGKSDYARLRMGIGHPGEKELVSYVLEPFDLQEIKELESFIDRGIVALESLIQVGLPETISKIQQI